MVFGREGFKSLRIILGATVASIAVAGFLVAGSYWYWQAEKKSDQQSQRLLLDVRSRLDILRRERDDLRNSGSDFQLLTARGVFVAEQRLDLVEALNALKIRHKLLAMEFEVSPQRIMRMTSGETFPAVDVLGSRIKLKIRAYHDGDLVAFLDEFPRMQRGFFQVDKCVIKRSADINQQVNAPVQVAMADGTSTLTGADSAGRNAVPGVIEAECMVEWITLADKAKPRPAKNDLSFAVRK
jgi:hypothetical protein